MKSEQFGLDALSGHTQYTRTHAHTHTRTHHIMCEKTDKAYENNDRHINSSSFCPFHNT